MKTPGRGRAFRGSGGCRLSGAVSGLEGQLHLAQVPARLDEDQRAFVQHHHGCWLAAQRDGRGLGRDGGLRGSNLVGVRG